MFCPLSAFSLRSAPAFLMQSAFCALTITGDEKKVGHDLYENSDIKKQISDKRNFAAE